MSIEIYHNNRCTKSRGACSLLDEQGIQPEIREYLKNPPTEAELKELLKLLGIPAEQLMRKGEAIFKEKFAGKKLNEAAAIKAMLEYPILIERPIVIDRTRKKAIVARPPELLLDFLK